MWTFKEILEKDKQGSKKIKSKTVKKNLTKSTNAEI